MYKIIFYISIFIHLFHILTGNTSMINYSFQSIVIIGLIELINRR